MCYLNDFYDISLIVAEFKKLDGARYSKEMHLLSQGQKVDKNHYQKAKIRLNLRPYSKN